MNILYENIGIELIPKQLKHLGVVPYSYDNSGNLLFMLGKEHYEKQWNAALKYSPFGGSPELKDDNAQAGAARECYEESMGFFGTMDEIYTSILHAPMVYRSKYAIIYPMHVPYIPFYSKLYSNVYDYLSQCIKYTETRKPIIPTCPEGYLEKIAIKWFTMDEIIKNRNLMRQQWNDFFILVVLKQEFTFNQLSDDNKKFVIREQKRLKNKKGFY